MPDKDKVTDAITKKKLSDFGIDVEESKSSKTGSGTKEVKGDNIKSKKLKVLTTSSVAKLVELARENPKVIQIPFDDLVVEHSLTFKDDYSFDESVKLTPPIAHGKNQNKYVFSMKESKDKENCLAILDALPGLTPAQATDENLWVTLVFNQFNDYVRKRWSNPKKPESQKKHWFASGWRQLTSDNAIARLWWVEYLSRKADPNGKKGLKDILLSTAEYRTTLLERPTSVRATVVLQSILEVTKEEIKKNGKDLDRSRFRNIMKEVGFVGKRRLLSALKKNNLKQTLKPIFQKKFK